MPRLQVKVLIKGANQDLIRSLLAAAEHEGVPASVIESSAIGVMVPPLVAMRAGLLDDVLPQPEPEPELEIKTRRKPGPKPGSRPYRRKNTPELAEPVHVPIPALDA